MWYFQKGASGDDMIDELILYWVEKSYTGDLGGSGGKSGLAENKGEALVSIVSVVVYVLDVDVNDRWSSVLYW